MISHRIFKIFIFLGNLYIALDVFHSINKNRKNGYEAMAFAGGNTLFFHIIASILLPTAIINNTIKIMDKYVVPKIDSKY